MYGVQKWMAVDALRNLNDRSLFYFAEPAQYLINDGCFIRRYQVIG